MIAGSLAMCILDIFILYIYAWTMNSNKNNEFGLQTKMSLCQFK